MRTKLIGTMAVLAMTGAAIPAQAAVLVPGATLFPAPGEPDPTGGAILATQTVPFSLPGSFSGSLTSTVISGDPSNALGGLTYTYQLNNNAAAPNELSRLAVLDFIGFQTDTSYQTPAAGVPPAFIDRPTGDVIRFNFSDIGQGPIPPGQSSAVLVVQTDGPWYGPTVVWLNDPDAISVLSFGPWIPEPTTLGVAAFAAHALIRRR